MTLWERPRKILCIRPDNMGDLLMSAPAIAALKETFDCHITLLTSSMAKGIASFLPTVDECLIWDVPWVKGTETFDPVKFWNLTSRLQEQKFDAAVIFTVFSQNPLPMALVATLAGIPNTLAYCRENPYQLLTHWLPEEEPYRFIRHQVRRDLDLVAAIGARTPDEKISIRPKECENDVVRKLIAAGVDISRPWIIFHPGVSEKKREYPPHLWVEAGKTIATTLGHQVIITGAEKEKDVAEVISTAIGPNAFNLAGTFALAEFIKAIQMAPLVVSVNTGTVHIAAAVQTKVIVLYALTNPQHPPWKSIGKVLPYSVPEEMQSSNPVLRFVQDEFFGNVQSTVTPKDIVEACYELLIEKRELRIEELVSPSQGTRQSKNAKHPELQRTISLPEK